MSKIVSPSTEFTQLLQEWEDKKLLLPAIPSKPVSRPTRNPKIKELRLLGFDDEADREQAIWEVEKKENLEARKKYTRDRDSANAEWGMYWRVRSWELYAALKAEGRSYCESELRWSRECLNIVEASMHDEYFIKCPWDGWGDSQYHGCTCDEPIVAYLCEECIAEYYSETPKHGFYKKSSPT